MEQCLKKERYEPHLTCTDRSSPLDTYYEKEGWYIIFTDSLNSSLLSTTMKKTNVIQDMMRLIYYEQKRGAVVNCLRVLLKVFFFVSLFGINPMKRTQLSQNHHLEKLVRKTVLHTEKKVLQRRKRIEIISKFLNNLQNKDDQTCLVGIKKTKSFSDKLIS